MRPKFLYCPSSFVRCGVLLQVVLRRSCVVITPEMEVVGVIHLMGILKSRNGQFFIRVFQILLFVGNVACSVRV